ncbi:hypothetical protein F511_47423 [Dorcoceras hygrometricum]|uniref:Secreted protein n=1 Tax=Dorcoceras hygrometricum TaxID=472368 RepID=A0A2Z6ZR29_9LAMI|nr:hypothetical protein F511_47423 [Dorcoceras hygrometricum]
MAAQPCAIIALWLASAARDNGALVVPGGREEAEGWPRKLLRAGGRVMLLFCAKLLRDYGRTEDKCCATGWRNQRHAPHLLRQACGQAPHATWWRRPPPCGRLPATISGKIVATAKFFF